MASGATEHLELKHEVLAAGDNLRREDPSRESVIVVLSGECSVEVGSESFTLKRQSVFLDAASAVYIPANAEFSLSTSSFAEVVTCSGDASPAGTARQIGPEEVACRTVGQGAYERRVCDIVGLNIPAQHLVLGETFNEPGKWSSFPPHKHDEDRLPEEAKMEEVYFFKIDPPEGFGLQRLYSPKDGYDRATVIKDNTIVAIPEGYHPVSAAPGCNVYYLWALWGEKRELAPFDDPEFEPVKARLATH